MPKSSCKPVIFLKKVCPFVVDRIAVAGFSHGPATAVRAMTLAPNHFRVPILLEGWFYIDVSESARIEFSLSQTSFWAARVGQEWTMYLGQFAATVYKNTQVLRSNAPISCQPWLTRAWRNRASKFRDVIFWLQDFVLCHFMKSAIGSKNAVDAYREIVDLTSDFLIENVKTSKGRLNNMLKLKTRERKTTKVYNQKSRRS